MQGGNGDGSSTGWGRAGRPTRPHGREASGANPEVGALLIERGTDLSICARVPGHYERPDEVLEVSAAEYAKLFPLR